MKKHNILLTVIVMLSAINVRAKTLVVYYSYTNNVERIISELRKQIDCDVVEVEPADKGLDYAANNYALGTKLLNAIKANPREASSYPKIDQVNLDLSQYGTVIIACPLWWSQMAAPFQTFLFQYGPGMAGKNIGLIVSSASSGISGVESDAKRLVPDGKFLDPSLWIRSSQTSDASSLIARWLKNIRYNDIAAGIGNAIQFNAGNSSFCVYDLKGGNVASDPESIVYLPRGIYIIRQNGYIRKISK